MKTGLLAFPPEVGVVVKGQLQKGCQQLPSRSAVPWPGCLLAVRATAASTGASRSERHAALAREARSRPGPEPSSKPAPYLP